MKISIKHLIFITLLFTAFSGCKKGGGSPDPVISDTTKPTILIVKPTAEQTFVSGGAITFQATFSDNIKLKSYEIVISKVVLGGFILKNVPTSIPFGYIKSSTSFSSGVKQEVLI